MWQNMLILLEDFKEEVISESNIYINDLRNINPKLLESKRILILNLLIEKLIISNKILFENKLLRDGKKYISSLFF